MQPHDELYHYGVKGMKWGVRRDFASSFIKRHPRLNRLNDKGNALNDLLSKAQDFSDPAKRRKAYKIAGGAVAIGAAATAGFFMYKNRQIKLSNLAAKASILARQQAHYDDVFNARVTKIGELKKMTSVDPAYGKLIDSILADIKFSAADRLTWDPEFATLAPARGDAGRLARALWGAKG